MRFDSAGDTCAISDDISDTQPYFYITIFNMNLGLKIAKMRHQNCPVIDALVLRRKTGLITSTLEGIHFWSASYSKLVSKPIEFISPELQIETTECFAKDANNELFLNMDKLELDVSVTRMSG